MTNFRPLLAVFAVGLLLALGAVCRSAYSLAADAPRVTPLGPGDPISIRVIGQPDPTSVYVSDDGTIDVPFVGNVQVAGMSPAEAAARVAKALKDGGFFVDPQVIIVTQPRSQLVTVTGEVHSPGRFPVTPGTTIFELLAQAGGRKETASDVGYVLRKDDDGHINRYPVKLNELADIKEFLPTSGLMGGDSLVIPVAGIYFVTGEVASPGKYYIEPGMTVMQAIVHAGGVTARGSEHRIEVKRLGKDGGYKVIHAKPGDPIQADDVIRVKESIF
jgi:polysaccharide export outer membrane protein